MQKPEEGFFFTRSDDKRLTGKCDACPPAKIHPPPSLMLLIEFRERNAKEWITLCPRHELTLACWFIANYIKRVLKKKHPLPLSRSMVKYFLDPAAPLPEPDPVGEMVDSAILSASEKLAEAKKDEGASS